MRPARCPNAPAPRLLLAGAVLLCAIAAAVAVGAGDARGQSKQQRLENVRHRQDALTERIQRQSGEVNALLGRVTELRQRESAANAELAEREAELAEATAELEAGRERLAELRAELRDSSDELGGLLVAMYKSEETDVLGVLLSAADFDELASQSEYLQRIESYKSDVIERTRTLRDETDALVTELETERERIEAARDAVAARRDELAVSRAELESRQAALASARRGRREALSGLGDRESDLVEALSQPRESPTSTPPPPAPAEAPPPVPGESAQLGADGLAIPPASAPAAVKSAIAAANAIVGKPYVWGGGHGSFEDSGYDCSGAVSYALHGAGVLSAPLDSTGLMFWGGSGPGSWITVYAHSGHAYVVIAGLRFDTSGTGGSGPRWHADARSSSGFIARHPSGL